MTTEEHDAIMVEVEARIQVHIDQLKDLLTPRFDHIDHMLGRLLRCSDLDDLKAAIEASEERLIVYCQRILAMVQAEIRRREEEDEQW